MIRDFIESGFRDTAGYVEDVVFELGVLQSIYRESDHPQKQARINALQAKINVFKDVKLDPNAYPWSED